MIRYSCLILIVFFLLLHQYDFCAPFDLLGMWYHYYGGPQPVAITNQPGGGIVHAAMGLDFTVKARTKNLFDIFLCLALLNTKTLMWA